MSPIRLPAPALILVMMVTAGVARAQLDTASPPWAPASLAETMDSATPTITKRVNEVNLIFTVTDKHGHFVNNLTQDQVQVLDNHQPPDRITYFQAQTDLPLRVALLVDTSDSVAARFAFEQRAAAAFLRQSLHNPSDAGLVAGFDSDIHVMRSLTSDVGQLANAVTRLTTGGTTHLYDAIRYAAQELRSRQERPSRRAVILITDGVDNGSRSTLEEAVSAALRSETIIFALLTSTPSSFRPDRPQDNVTPGVKALTRLTQATGGRVLSASNDRQIARAFDSIQQQLRSQYAVGYRPADWSAQGQYRSIALRIPAKKRYRTFHRQGYYADESGLAD